MIGSLRGTVLDRAAQSEVLVEVGGVGYRVQVSPRTLSHMPEVGGEVFFLIHHHIREDAQILYGFLSRDERQTFADLISAHGVGPSMALGILGVYDPEQLRKSVAANDAEALCLVPGVGKKTAARLLLELKAKLAVPDFPGAGSSDQGAGGGVVGEVREALAGLGYATEEIREVLRDLPAQDTSAALLREALRVLGSSRA
jgi:holliday junction DNA helicase RuvA